MTIEFRRALGYVVPYWRRLALVGALSIVSTVLSADQVNDPAICSIVGASAALMISPIPFAGPVAAVRMGYINDELVVNPTFSEMAYSKLDHDPSYTVVIPSRSMWRIRTCLPRFALTLTPINN